jgi:hypothetical protein
MGGTALRVTCEIFVNGLGGEPGNANCFEFTLAVVSDNIAAESFAEWRPPCR